MTWAISISSGRLRSLRDRSRRKGCWMGWIWITSTWTTTTSSARRSWRRTGDDTGRGQGRMPNGVPGGILLLLARRNRHIGRNLWSLRGRDHRRIMLHDRQAYAVGFLGRGSQAPAVTRRDIDIPHPRARRIWMFKELREGEGRQAVPVGVRPCQSRHRPATHPVCQPTVRRPR